MGKKKYQAQPEGSNLCGAYAMAYWLKEKNPECGDVVQIAEDLYEKFIFEKADFQSAKIYGFVEGYCNPARMMLWLSEEQSITCRFYLGNDRDIGAIYQSLEVSDFIKGLVSEELLSVEQFSDDQAGLEIVKNSEGGLHYLYVYKDGTEKKAIDPGDGCLYDRDELLGNRYTETKAGIVIG